MLHFSLKVLEAEKTGDHWALISRGSVILGVLVFKLIIVCISSPQFSPPVFGFLPVLALLKVLLKVPNPSMEIFLPPATSVVIVSMTAARADSASVLERPDLAATEETKSASVVLGGGGGGRGG